MYKECIKNSADAIILITRYLLVKKYIEQLLLSKQFSCYKVTRAKFRSRSSKAHAIFMIVVHTLSS